MKNYIFFGVLGCCVSQQPIFLLKKCKKKYIKEIYVKYHSEYAKKIKNFEKIQKNFLLPLYNSLIIGYNINTDVGDCGGFNNPSGGKWCNKTPSGGIFHSKAAGLRNITTKIQPQRNKIQRKEPS